MTTALIIGSGPAAAATAMALSSRRDIDITVVDIGLRLEQERAELVETLSDSVPAQWNAGAVERVARRDAASYERGVPQKRTFGSDYPFRDIGQLDGVSADAGVNSALISAAYGGFSTVWGSQLMPFTSAVFDDWPFPAADMRPHYEAILREIPFAAEEDDLARVFPLIGDPSQLPPMSSRSMRVLEAYARHRQILNRRGITMGKARLAFDAPNCVRCGLCMTGCPYGLIYSAAHTLDRLRYENRVRYHTGLLVVRVSENGPTVDVTAREIESDRIHTFEADRVYLACGAAGTTRLVAASRGLFDTEFSMGESQQFILPLLSLRGTPDPRTTPDFTLNQFNMVLPLGDETRDISQLHFYTFNSAFVDALPAILRRRETNRVRTQLLRRLTVAFGYLPSWRSPRLTIRVQPNADAGKAPGLRVSAGPLPAGRDQMLRTVMRRLSRSAPLLDLYPVRPMLHTAGTGKSYHWGGSFPHTAERSPNTGSDRLGRVGTWKRIHIVDASVFPTVPAMTFTLTIMANAHRIATESMEAEH